MGEINKTAKLYIAVVALLLSMASSTTAQTRQWFTAPNASTPDGSPRTLAARMSEVLTIKDFGAIGDGKTDDTAAYEACRAVSEKADRPVGVQDGNYLINGRVMTASEVVTMAMRQRGGKQ